MWNLSLPQCVSKSPVAEQRFGAQFNMSTFSNRRTRHWRFTLVECFAAIAILGIVVTLAVPKILEAREAARRSTCENIIRNYSHACYGDVVQLNQEGGIESISGCPICGTGRGWFTFFDSSGRILNDEDVPHETRRVAVDRLTR